MPDVETEVTYRIEGVPDALDEFTELRSYHQTDYYLSPPDRDFISGTVNYLRVRKRDDGYCSLDRHIVRNSEETLEYEVDVESADDLLELLRTLDFEVYVTVSKERAVFDADGFEIVLDDVEGLGTFIEIEATEEFEREKLNHIVSTLGLEDAKKIEGRGYPDLVLEKQ